MCAVRAYAPYMHVRFREGRQTAPSHVINYIITERRECRECLSDVKKYENQVIEIDGSCVDHVHGWQYSGGMQER